MWLTKKQCGKNSLNSRLSGVSITGQKEWAVFTDGLHTLHSFNSQHVWLITSFCFKKSRGTKQHRKKEKKTCHNTTKPQRALSGFESQMFPTDSHVKGLVPGGSAIWEKGQKLRVGEWLEETGYWGACLWGHCPGSGPFLSPLCSLAAMRWAASATCSQCCDALPSLRLQGMDPTNQGLKL